MVCSGEFWIFTFLKSVNDLTGFDDLVVHPISFALLVVSPTGLHSPFSIVSTLSHFAQHELAYCCRFEFLKPHTARSLLLQLHELVGTVSAAGGAVGFAVVETAE